MIPPNLMKLWLHDTCESSYKLILHVNHKDSESMKSQEIVSGNARSIYRGNNQNIMPQNVNRCYLRNIPPQHTKRIMF